MMKITGKRKIVEVIRHLILGIVFFYPWIETGAGNYHALTYFWVLFRADSVREQFLLDFAAEYARGEITYYGTDIISSIYAFYAILAVLCLSLLVSGLCFVLACRGRRIKWLEVINVILGLEAMTLGPVLGMYITMKILLFPMVYVACMLGSMFVAVLCDTQKEREGLSSEEKRKKREKKKRLKFEGHYGRLYYRLMGKNSLYHKKNLFVLMSATLLISSFLFTGLALREIFQEGYGADLSIYRTGGLTKTIQDYIILLVGISLVLLTLCFRSYWQGKMKDLGVLLTLGIRRGDLFRYLSLELIIGCTIALLAGVLLGQGYLLILRACLAWRVPEVKWGSCGILSLILTVLIQSALLWFSYHIGRDLYDMKTVVDTRAAAVQEEPRPGKGAVAFLAVGFLLTLAGVGGFHVRKSAENILFLVLFMLGMFFLLYGGWGQILRIREKKERCSVNRMLKDERVRFRFKTTTCYTAAFAVIHICVLFYLMVRMVSGQIPQSDQELFPYDYMCLADGSESGVFEQLEKECGAKVDSYPMMRVTAYENTESLLFVGDGGQSFFEGINIGVSQSVYRKLKQAIGQQPQEEMPLDEEGQKIYVVYQQDKGTRSQPLDWMKFEVSAHLHLGTRAQASIDQYPARTIVGEEVTSLTGVFGKGKIENIVVFSDSFFDKMQPQTVRDGQIKGPNRLVLIRVPEKGKERAKELLAAFSEEHIAGDTSGEYEDTRIRCVYEKQEALEKFRYESVLEEIVNGFLMVCMVVMGICLMYLKLCSEMEDRKERYTFFNQFGMYKNERIQRIRKEISLFFSLPGSIASLMVPVLTVVVLELRGYTGKDLWAYLRLAGPFVLGYLLLQFLVYLMLQKYTVHRTERE